MLARSDLYCVVVVRALINTCALGVSNQSRVTLQHIRVAELSVEGRVGINSDVGANYRKERGYVGAVGETDDSVFNGDIVVFRFKNVQLITYGIVYRLGIHALQYVVKIYGFAADIALLKLRV